MVFAGSIPAGGAKIKYTDMQAHEELKQLFAERDSISVAIEINGFTGWRTTVIDDLTDEEAEKLLKIHQPIPEQLDAEFNALKTEFIRKEWKSNILALAEKIGFKEKGSFHKFNDWMIAKSKFKKHLNAHNIEELKQLHQQMRAAQSNNARSSRKAMTKAWWEKADRLKQYN